LPLALSLTLPLALALALLSIWEYQSSGNGRGEVGQLQQRRIKRRPPDSPGRTGVKRPTQGGQPNALGDEGSEGEEAANYADSRGF